MAGIWLALTPLSWDHPGDGWLPAGLNAVLSGFAVMLLGVVRLAQSVSLIIATLIGCLIGTWLIASPFLLNNVPTAAALVGITFGIGLLAAAILGVAGRRPSPYRCAESTPHGQ